MPGRRSLGASLLLVLMSSLPARPGGAATAAVADVAACDHDGDTRISVKDALIVLRTVTASCQSTSECDADGDGSETVSDALALLLYGVGLPVELQCGCLAIDECFEDADCVLGYPPNYHCAGYLCVECEFDFECASGFVCDGCHGACVPDAP